MQLDFSDEQKALRDSLRRNLEKNCPISSVRAIIDSAAGHDAALWRSLSQGGFLAAAIPEDFGGVGVRSPRVAGAMMQDIAIFYKAGFKGGTGLITLTPQDVVKHQTMACHRFPADCVGCYIGVSGLQP